MPAPKNRMEFYEVVRRSGIVDPSRLEDLAARVDLAAEDVPEASKELVALGLVTTFHARQLLKGRYRGFALGKYLVLEQLGEGGMGKVFLCVHMIMRRLVAVKILARELANDPGTVERFQREARAVAALDHPNIVRAHDMDQEGEVHFIVMEYVDGISLHDLIRKRGPLDVASACHYIRQAAIGLQQVMDSRMIHRDIKPGNLLLDRRGTVKILDLGLARFSSEKHGSLTQQFDEGSVLGTADYLAPEQAMDSHRVDIRADIYSLGATFYFLLSGKPPFEGGSITQKLLFHQMQNPPSLKKLRPDLPGELVTVVEQMMAKNPQERFQTPHDVAYALEPWTRTPLPLPREEELPRHCPYVQRAAQGDLSTSLTTLQSAMTVAQSGVRLPATVGAAMSAGGSGPLAESYGGVERDDSGVTSNSGVSSQANVRLSDASFPGRDPSTGRLLPPTSAHPPSLNGIGLAPSTRRRKRSKARRQLAIAGAIGGGVLLVVLLTLFLGGGGEDGKQEMTVSSKGEGPRVYKTLTEAWQYRDAFAKSGTITIEDEEILEQFKPLAKPGEKGHWRINGRAGGKDKRVRWLPLKGASATKPLLHLEGVANLSLDNFEFQGEDKINDLVIVKGQFESLHLTRLHFRGVKQSALRFTNCSLLRRSTLQALECYAGQQSQAFLILESTAAAPTKNVEVGGCVIRGAGENKDPKEEVRAEAGIVIDGPMENVTLANIIAENLRTGIHFKGVLKQPTQLTIQNGSFTNMGAGLRFDDLPVQKGPEINVGGITFVKTTCLAMIGAKPDKPLRPEPAPAAMPNLHWVWTSEGDPVRSAPAGVRYFRTTFAMPASSGSVFLDLVCDDGCKASLNGKPLTPANVDGAKPEDFALSATLRRVYTVDITALVRADAPNVLTIEASTVKNKKAGPRGLLARVFNPTTGKILTVSDDKWLWYDQKPPAEWTRADFQGGSIWRPVRAVAPYDQRRQLLWSKLTWDSEVQSLFQKKSAQPWLIVQPVAGAPNKCDPFSYEAYPTLGAELINPRPAGR